MHLCIASWFRQKTASHFCTQYVVIVGFQFRNWKVVVKTFSVTLFDVIFILWRHVEIRFLWKTYLFTIFYDFVQKQSVIWTEKSSFFFKFPLCLFKRLTVAISAQNHRNIMFYFKDRSLLLNSILLSLMVSCPWYILISGYTVVK